MRTVEASEFGAGCLQLMDEVAKSVEPVLITKDGRPVARLGPVEERPKTLAGLHRGRMRIVGDIVEPLEAEEERPRTLFGLHEGQVEILGDIISPIEVEWEAMR